jgi:hypothetical protein
MVQVGAGVAQFLVPVAAVGVMAVIGVDGILAVDVLSFADLRAVTQVAVAGGAGVVVGGLIMAFWGGPARRRMRGVLLSAITLAAFALLTGGHRSVPLIAVGVFGVFAALTVMNSIYTTIIQVKVPPRAHGRVFAVNTVFAFSTLPIGFILVGPGVSAAIGLGPTYLLFGGAIAAIALAALRYRPLARFDTDVPDTEPEDALGLAELRRRSQEA